jgi:membrane protein YdbS with pleckstrin-like domain
VSRAGARSGSRTAAASRVRKRPLLVWAIYILGGIAVAVLVLSALFTAGAFFGSDDADVVLDVSPLAVLVWGGLIALAVVTWLWRRRAVRR